MRKKHDFYPTPTWATETLLREVPVIKLAPVVLEPCAGNGQISTVLRANCRGRVVTNEPYQSGEFDSKVDARAHYLYRNLGPVEWVVTNPPFNVAMELLSTAYEHVLDGVAFLLRLSFLEPVASRAEFLDKYPPTRLIVLPRISFTGDKKTDSVTCAWMVWEKKADQLRDITIIRRS